MEEYKKPTSAFDRKIEVTDPKALAILAKIILEQDDFYEDAAESLGNIEE